MKSLRYPVLYQINTRVWLTELARSLGRRAKLDDIPDAELDALAQKGFDWIWLLSVWQTGPEAQKVSRSNPEWHREFHETLPDLRDEPLAAFLFFGRPLSDGLKAIVLLAAGFVIVPVGFALYFLADGHFGAFFADAMVAAAGRVSVPPVSLSATANGLLIGLMLMLPVIILAAAGCVFSGVLKNSTLPFLAAWTAGALAGVLATRAALVIYFLPLLPPLCLMAAAFLERYGHRSQGCVRFFVAPTAIAAVVIGGTSLAGGRGSIVSSFFGVLIIATLEAGLAHVGATEPVGSLRAGSKALPASSMDMASRAIDAMVRGAVMESSV